MIDHLSRNHRAVFVVNLLLLVVTGIVVFYKLKPRIDLGSWVLVVPVQIGVQREGVPKLLTLGMPRRHVIANLGSPRIARRPVRGGNNTPELTPQVFAWVTFDESDAVKTIEFDLSESRRDYAGQQQVALFYNGHRYLLKSGMSLHAVRRLFDQAQVDQAQVVIVEFMYSEVRSIKLKDTGLRLDFSDDRLISVEVRKKTS